MVGPTNERVGYRFEAKVLIFRIAPGKEIPQRTNLVLRREAASAASKIASHIFMQPRH